MDTTAITSAGFGEDGPDTLIGPYKLVRQIGEGGMGVVYHAQQVKPIRRDVALKVIKPGMDVLCRTHWFIFTRWPLGRI